MGLNKIELRDFRNYEALSLEFDAGVNLIVGDNAQGKTKPFGGHLLSWLRQELPGPENFRNGPFWRRFRGN